MKGHVNFNRRDEEILQALSLPIPWAKKKKIERIVKWVRPRMRWCKLNVMDVHWGILVRRVQGEL